MAGADVGGEEGALGSHYDWSRERRPNCDYLAFGHLVKISVFSDRTRSLLGMQSIHCPSCSDPRSVLIHHFPSFGLVPEIAGLAGEVVL